MINTGDKMEADERVPQDPYESLCIECLRCGHRWLKRVAGRPKMCPKCHSRKWDTLRDDV
jgi:Zn finger protein HypA/HybF involved in hydrogenase expression